MSIKKYCSVGECKYWAESMEELEAHWGRIHKKQ